MMRESEITADAEARAIAWFMSANREFMSYFTGSSHKAAERIV